MLDATVDAREVDRYSEPPEQAAPSRGMTMKFRFGNGDQPLPGFTIQRGVGIGGFGEVYFATNAAGKEVALKQIQRNLEVELRGVRQCLNLKHPNLIGLYDIQLDDHDQGWIIMEYVSGESLRDVLDRNPNGLPAEELLRWFGQIASGVCYLHDHGIVHRDLKPANIFEDEGIVKIGDYGLAKFISCSRRGGQTESVGTFHYMAPEVGKGEYGKEIDIYALGVILYEMATGNVPFEGQSSQEIIMKHLTDDPDVSVLPEPIREVVRTAMAKSPSARYSDVRDMVRPLGFRIDDRSMLVMPSSGRVSGGVPEAVDARVLDEPPPIDQINKRAARKGGGGRRSAGGRRDGEFQEPIARSVQRAWLELNRWWQSVNINPGLKNLILAVALIFCAINSVDLLALIVLGLVFYVPYYAVWWLLQSPQTASVQHARHRKSPVHAVPVAAAVVAPAQPPPIPRSGKRFSEKQWRVAQRMQLARAPASALTAEITGAWLGSSFVVVVFSSLVGVFLIGRGAAVQPVLLGLCWAALTALGTAWTAIALGKRWQKEEGDGALRRFVQLTFGFGIGGMGYLLAQYLMLPWEQIATESISDVPVHRWSGFFAPDGTPLLPAYLAYFPLVMGLIGWWKQVDPLRRTRFSFWSVLWAAIAAGMVHMLIPFPQPWGALTVAIASIAVQLSTPWINPNERHMASSVPEGGVA